MGRGLGHSPMSSHLSNLSNLFLFSVFFDFASLESLESLSFFLVFVRPGSTNAQSLSFLKVFASRLRRWGGQGAGPFTDVL